MLIGHLYLSLEQMESLYGRDRFLGPVTNATPVGRARRLLDSGAALTDADESLCRQIADGSVAATE